MDPGRAFHRRVFLFPAVDHSADGDRRGAGKRMGKPADPAGPGCAGVYRFSGGALHNHHGGRWVARSLPVRPVRISFQADPAPARAHSIHSPDRGCGGGIRSAARSPRLDQPGACPIRPDPGTDIVSAHARRDPAGPRFLQHLDRPAAGGQRLGTAGPAPDRRRARAGRRPAAGLHPGYFAAACAASAGSRGAGLPFRLHVVRGDPDPRRAGVLDRGNGNLHPGAASAQPAGRRAAFHLADRDAPFS